MTADMNGRSVLNVGGNSREIPLPPEYDGWDNVLLDIDARCNPDVLCDARDLTGLPATTYDSVYCSHNLEHYHYHEVGRVLAGFQHVLKEDGFVCIRVPDMSALMRIVVERNLDIDDVLYQSQAGPIAVRDVIYGYGLQIERSGSDFFAHKTGFSEKSLVAKLRAAGFPIVFSHCSNLEVIVYAFKHEPTVYAADLLKLSNLAESTVGVCDESSAENTTRVSSATDSLYQPSLVKPYCRNGPGRRLHIGGTKRSDGWEVLNTSLAPWVDHVGNANDLSRFADGTFLEIYASHVVEHLDYKFELMETLKEWYRVLEPGGRIMVSVPDLDTLAGLIVAKNALTVRERFFVMKMLFGGHVDQHDYHVVGLNQEFLGHFLNEAGYIGICRVDNFNLFDDTSSMVYKGIAISLNMCAEKPFPAGQDATSSVVELGAHADQGGDNGAEKLLTAGADGVTAVGADPSELPEAGLAESIQGPRTPIVLMTAAGLAISVPGSLASFSTYVLLEQEKWFEKEGDFLARWLKPGMNAIDIGANVGVYSLPIARTIGVGGRVFAFEPGAGARALLEASRVGNGLDNLQVLSCALADEEKQGWLQEGASSELNSLSVDRQSTGESSPVRVSTLDIQEGECSWPSIDFVKIDAEGQEERIVAGGRSFFARHSPLVMYEIRHGGGKTGATRWVLEAIGFRSYRLLGDASCLVPVASDEQFDPYELNLFAAKPDRAAHLAQLDLLFDKFVAHALTDSERAQALRGLLAQDYARAFEFSVDDIVQCPFGEALVAYAAYRYAGLSCGRRYAALLAAFELLNEYCAKEPTPASLASLVRVALDLGQRHVATEALGTLVGASGVEIDQPFYPPCARYENISPLDRESAWFVAAANEQFELARSHSSCFQSGDLDRLKWLCDSPFSSPEINRRLILEAVRRGQELPELLTYVDPAHRHQNPVYWTVAGFPMLSRMR